MEILKCQKRIQVALALERGKFIQNEMLLFREKVQSGKISV